MAARDDSPRTSPLVSEVGPTSSSSRTVPILQPNTRNSSPSPGEPMEVNTPPATASMGPPTRASQEPEMNGALDQGGLVDQNPAVSVTGPNAAAAAMAGGQQPKVVQTAFIHKLYNMLEDPNIQHLISWSNSAESFVMSPSNDFSKVLSQYFKHTNISSFVRQLNMYGFHKVSDVFHTGSAESSLWEFKHGNGSFKRGNLVGLREIKRRASRHALVHRDSYTTPKPPLSQPGTPSEPIPSVQESVETRLAKLEHALYDVHSRLARSDDNVQFLHFRNQMVTDTLYRSFQLNHDMARTILALVPSQDAPICREIINIQGEIQRQTDFLRSMEDPITEQSYSGSRVYLSGLSLDNPSISPRQLAQDDLRRHPGGAGGGGGLGGAGGPPMRQNHFRPALPSHLSITPRRYGSIGAGPGTSSPSSSSSMRPHAAPLPPPPPAPLAPLHSPPPANLSRRHTSADIRIQGWQQQQPHPQHQQQQLGNPSPFASGQSSSQWPSSPKRLPVANDDQRLRESLSAYTLGGGGGGGNGSSRSRPTTPPMMTNGSTAAESMGNWSWGASRTGGGGGGGGGSGLFNKDSSAPPTRRGSMAHILNPAETAERDEENDEQLREEDRKRKRLQ